MVNQNECFATQRRRNLAIVAMLGMLGTILAIILGLVLASGGDSDKNTASSSSNNNDSSISSSPPPTTVTTNVFETPAFTVTSSLSPSQNPTLSTIPTAKPSLRSSQLPTQSLQPNVQASSEPSRSPTTSTKPSIQFAIFPSSSPSFVPTILPSETPSISSVPSYNPSSLPSQSSVPSFPPSMNPTTSPSLVPSLDPTMSVLPTTTHSQNPTTSMVPTQIPSTVPSSNPTPFHLETYLISNNVALKGGQEFLNTESYQSKTLRWLLTNDDIDTMSLTQLSQRYALGCLYYATNNVSNPYYSSSNDDGSSGDGGWKYTANWLSSSSHECDRSKPWIGVECNRLSEQLVVRLDLRKFHLTGTLPAEIGLLVNLQSLDLYDNPIYNSQYEWLAKLSSTLQYLYFGSTYFEYNDNNMSTDADTTPTTTAGSSAIPAEIAQLTNLKQYEADYTLLEGTLDGTIFQNLQQLEYLSLGGNNYMESTIPTQILTLPNLKYFYIENANISSAKGIEYLNTMGIAADGTSESKLVDHWGFGNSNIGGSLQNVQWSKLAYSLQGLNIAGCSIGGSIPTQLGLLDGMTHLWLDTNNLTGTIPSELGLLSNLRSLNLTNNPLLEGTVPQELCQLRSTLGGELIGLEIECSVECACCTNVCS